MKTGQLIRDLRLKKGITQEELAAKTDISVRTIQRIESGDVDPRAYTLQAIASALEVEYHVLVNSEGDLEMSDEKSTDKWLPLLHLSGLLLFIIPPIIIWILKRDQVKGIRRHATDVINFQLSMNLYILPCLLLSIHPISIVLAVFSQVMIIVNTIKVTNKQAYRYPLNINFLKQSPVD
ncbi:MULTISPECIES: helix-turn-helix domain-containing protein [unclassified Sphingobacterium]|uniref:helix-turn-helix domain-containing protein n=1 Tax=unclassified Sphingobacterium TaxID=2609468 RepID=UPI0010453082|nr:MULTISPECIES: helix-turn-helix domain-containing protein [unclassified Sphingobacterium]MCS3556959.1 transcriptional regulator with XRE-family HTH domain [Sphingobacterium sp. JUb21]TCQ98963.1 putative Tic20 family protein [Sphingobacterium sp. JUb20]